MFQFAKSKNRTKARQENGSLSYLRRIKGGCFNAAFGRPCNGASILGAVAASNRSSSHNRPAMHHTRRSAASSIKRFESLKLRRKRCLVRYNGIFTSSVELMGTPAPSSSLDQFFARHSVTLSLLNIYLSAFGNGSAY